MLTESKAPDTTLARIQALMARRNWTQSQTAAYLGVPMGTFGNWIQGTRKPNIAVIRLLNVLGQIEALAPALHESFIPKGKA